jgi:hypothetical protein
MIDFIANNTRVSKKNIVHALKIRDGYMFMVKKIETVIFLSPLDKDETEDISLNDTFSLKDFLDVNMEDYFDDGVRMLDTALKDIENGNYKNDIFLIKDNFFSTPEVIRYVVGKYTYNPNIEPLSSEEIKIVRNYLSECEDKQRNRCEDYWKRYGANKLKFIRLKKDSELA